MVPRTVRHAVSVAVFVEVFVNLRVFSLPVELVLARHPRAPRWPHRGRALVPVVAFLVALGAYSEGKDEFRAAHRLVTFLMSVVGAAPVARPIPPRIAPFGCREGGDRSRSGRDL
jgi:hypothetical protein